MKRRVRPLQQTRREKPCANCLDRFSGLAETPPERNAGAGRFAIPGAVLRVVDHGANRHAERRNLTRPRTRNGVVGSTARDAVEREIPKTVVQPLRTQGPGTQEDRIGGPVAVAVVCLQRLVVERRDRPRVASGVEPIRRTRKQAAVQRLLQPPLGVAHHPLHLAEHHAAPLRRLRFPALALAADLDAPSLLLEVEPVEARKERSVEVDGKQVLVVGKAPGGEVESGAVLGGRGVHGRAQRAAQQREERPPAGKSFAAAPHHVLQDVCKAARIRSRGTKGHQEGVVVQRRIEVEVPGAGGCVDELRKLPAERGHPRAIPRLEVRSCG